MELLMKEDSLFTGVLSLCNAKYNFLYKYIKWGMKYIARVWVLLWRLWWESL